MAPTLTYRDLSRDDIASLTQILSNSIPRQHDSSNSSTSTPEANLPAVIARLPSHLKSRISCMAPGCSRHKHLNMAPLDDLSRELRHEAKHYVSTIWKPLSKEGLFDVKQNDMLDALGSIATLHPDPCSACWLEYVGLNVSASTALGAFIIGRISPGIYQKSKRLIWIEDVLRQMLLEQAAEFEISRMWEAGVEFRRTRKIALVEAGEERQYVAEYVRQARDLDLSLDVPWSTKLAPTEALKVNASTIDMNNWLDDMPQDDHAEAEANSPQHLIRRKPVPQAWKPSPKAATGSNYFVASQAQASRVASSVYSTHELIRSSHRESSRSLPSWPNSSTRPTSTAPNTGSQIIELYRRGTFPENAAFDARSSTDSRKRSAVYVFSRESQESMQQNRPL